jgi:hypothetical protein
VKLQQAVPGGQIANVNLEVNQDFQQRRGWTLATVDDPATTRVPAARGPHPAVAGQRNVVADAPQNHLRGHAIVDAIQQFFHEPRTRLCGKQVKRRPSLELALGIPKPPPTALALAEYFLAQGNHTRDSNHAIRLVAAQRFASCTPMGQRPPRDDEGVDFLISQPGLAQSVDSSGRQSLLHEFHQILVRPQTLDAEDLLNPFEDIRVFERRGVDRSRFCHRASLLGIIAHYSMASCLSPSKTLAIRSTEPRNVPEEVGDRRSSVVSTRDEIYQVLRMACEGSSIDRTPPCVYVA